MAMTHDELRELTGAYVLGALDETERTEIETHLATCASCAAEVKALLDVSSALAYAVPQHDPPAALRARVLKTAAGSGADGRHHVRDVRAGWAFPGWLAAAASIAAIGFGLYAMTLRERVGILEERLRDAEARAERVETEVAIARAQLDRSKQIAEIMAATDMRRIDLAGQAATPTSTGRAFYSPSRKQLVFTSFNLPLPAAGRQYQLWVMPPGGKPVSAGMLDMSPDGRIVAMADAPADVAISGVAVSEEPVGGVQSPTQIVLVGTF